MTDLTGGFNLSIRKWIFRDEKNDPLITGKLSRELDCGNILSSVLQARGIKTTDEAKAFLYSSDEEHDPYLLPDLELALNRIKIARTKGEKVCVYGDYDADGVTATVIMMSTFEKMGMKVFRYLPDRKEDGYSLNKKAIDIIHKNGATLIVTVDCGISCREEISYAGLLGIDVIVTDHHNCPETLPECVAVINPKRADSRYPFGHLSGAGVAYKLATVLIGDEAKPLLEFAAIGTVADVVSLTGENRSIVRGGLEIINNSPSPGVASLLVSASKSRDVSSETVAFILAPRINSAGRMKNANIAYDLLAEKDLTRANELAEKLNSLNRERQTEEQKIFAEAVEIIKKDSLSDDDVIVVGNDNWSIGVIGIVASKITEAANKPSMVISYDGDTGKCSGRSIAGFDLYDALKDSKGTLVSFGGHSLAAGAVIEKEKEEAFRKAINSYAKKNLTDEDRIRKIYIDTKIEPSDITVRNIEKLSLLEPTGADNAKPVVAFINAKIREMRLLSEGKHLKLTVEKDGFYLDAIKFNVGSADKKLYTGKSVHLAGSIGINDYNGRPQLIIKDIL